MPRDSQTSVENGDMNENVDGGSLDGFWYKIDMPRFMKGMVKSQPLSRSDVIVKSVMARSAFCKRREKILNHFIVDKAKAKKSSHSVTNIPYHSVPFSGDIVQISIDSILL